MSNFEAFLFVVQTVDPVSLGLCGSFRDLVVGPPSVFHCSARGPRRFPLCPGAFKAKLGGGPGRDWAAMWVSQNSRVPSPFFQESSKEPSETEGKTAGVGKERWLKRMGNQPVQKSLPGADVHVPSKMPKTRFPPAFAVRVLLMASQGLAFVEACPLPVAAVPRAGANFGGCMNE